MSDDDSGDVQLAEAAGSAETKPDAKPDTAISLCRIAVLVGKTQTDVVLPTEVPIGSLMIDAIRVIGDQLDAQGKDVSPLLDKTPGRWTFSFVAGSPMPAHKTLSEVGVYDGYRLVLQRVRSAEEYQPLVDDVIDAASMISADRFTAWNADMSRRVGAAIAVLGAIAAAVLVGVYAIAERSMWVPPLIAVAAALVALAAARLADRRYQNPDVATALALAAYPLAGVGGAAIVPGPWGAWHVVLGAGALITIAAVSAVLLQRVLVLASAITTVCAIVLIAGLARAFWSVGYVALGAWISLIALFVAQDVAKISMLFSRVPLPSVPTLGTALEEPDKSPRFIVAGAPGAQQYMAPGAREFEQRTEAANKYLIGTMLGVAVCLVAGTALVAQPGHRRYWAGFAFSLVVALIVLRRARTHADRSITAALLIAGSAIIATTFVRMALADGRMWVVLVVMIGLMALAAASVVAGVTLPEMQFNEVQRRFVELVELALVSVAYPMGVWITDIYGTLRGIR